MDNALHHLIRISADLRNTLAQLDKLALVSAGAMIDNVICIVEEKIDRDLTSAPRKPMPPDSAFAFLDAVIARIYAETPDGSEGARQ